MLLLFILRRPEPRKEIFWDLDGTLTGNPGGGYTMPFYAYNNWPECPQDRVGTFSRGSVCTSAAIVRKVSTDLILPVQLNFQNMCVR
jgi:hypothetical protein